MKRILDPILAALPKFSGMSYLRTVLVFHRRETGKKMLINKGSKNSV